MNLPTVAISLLLRPQGDIKHFKQHPKSNSNIAASCCLYSFQDLTREQYQLPLQHMLPLSADLISHSAFKSITGTGKIAEKTKSSGIILRPRVATVSCYCGKGNTSYNTQDILENRKMTAFLQGSVAFCGMLLVSC